MMLDDYYKKRIEHFESQFDENTPRSYEQLRDKIKDILADAGAGDRIAEVMELIEKWHQYSTPRVWM